jgi:transcriptional regulator with XRE-family HTH domain
MLDKKVTAPLAAGSADNQWSRSLGTHCGNQYSAFSKYPRGLSLVDIHLRRIRTQMLVSDLHENIRQHVLAAVRSRAITGTALAERIGVQQAHISNFLLGRRGLSIDSMDAILNALGINVEQLVAVVDQTPVRDEPSSALESIPLVRDQSAMNPIFANDEVQGKTVFPKALLRRLKAVPPVTRKLWVRFITVKADKALSAPMSPRLESGSVLLIDRHYCSLDQQRKDEPNLYLIRKGEALMVRWVEMQGTQLCLRPERNDHPLDFIPIDRKNPIESCIVGRVAHIATDLGSPAYRRTSALWERV